MAEATYGLRLAQGGAPLEAHAVEGVAGALFRPDIPTPVGGEGQIPLERARELADDPSIPLELVEIAEDLVEHAAALAKAALLKARTGLAIAAQQGLEGVDLTRLHDEFAIVNAPVDTGRVGTPDPPTTDPAVSAVVAAAPATVAPPQTPADQPATAEAAPAPADAPAPTPEPPPDEPASETTTGNGGQ